MPICARSPSVVLTYVWRIYQGTQFLENLQSASLDPRYLKLPTYSLQGGLQYVATVSVTTARTNLSAPITATASVALGVVPMGISAVIDGGLRRSVSIQDELQLDASSSFDIDDPSSGSLTYQWSCVQVAPLFGYPCAISTNSPSASKFIITFERGLQSISSQLYNFSVAVTNPKRGVFSSAYVIATVLSAAIPGVTMKLNKLNFVSTEKLYVNAEVKSKADLGVVRVKLTSPDISTELLTQIALTPLEVTSFASGPVAPSTQVIFPLEIVLSVGLLTPGLSYTLTLSATYISKGEGSATAPVSQSVSSQAIYVVSPPRSGSITASPVVNNANATSNVLQPYSLRTTGWTDRVSNYPITYAFAYYTTDVNKRVFLRSASQVPTMTAFLPAGSPGNGYLVTCVVLAVNIFGATASAETEKPAVIRSLAVTGSELTKFITTSFSTAFQTFNTALMAQSISGASAVLNRADCSTAPSCSTYMRYSCSTVAGTCGSCFVGYIGVIGSSNSFCRPTNIAPPNFHLTASSRRIVESFIARRHLGDNAVDSAVGLLVAPGNSGASCVLKTDCLSGICSRGACVEALQACPNACSGSGKCVFRNQLLEVVPQCAIQDMFCRPVCVCSSGYGGSDCSLITRSSLKVALVNRESLCVNLKRSMGYVDMTSDAMVQLAQSVSDIFHDAAQVNSGASLICADLLTRAIVANPFLASEDICIDLVVDALSSVVELGRNLLEIALLNQVMLALSSLAVTRQTIMATGEQNTAVVTRNIRLNIYKVSVKELLSPVGVELYVAQSALEELYKVPRTILTLRAPSSTQPAAPDRTTSIGVFVLQFNNNPYLYQSNATTTHVQIYDFSGSLSPASKMPSSNITRVSVTAVLQNKVSIGYFTGQAVIGQLKCRKQDMPYNLTARCPHSTFFNVSCPGNFFR